MLTKEQLEFIFDSTGNYIEVGCGDQLQPYFDPFLDDFDRYIETGKGYNRFLITACHAVGKTFTMARIGDSTMGRFDETKLISTAPTYRQVHDLLWKEWASCYSNKLPQLKRGQFNPGEPALWINPETFARGFSPQKKAQSESGQGTDSVFQGYHAKFLTIIIFDEATGIPPQLWAQAEGLMNAGYRVVFVAIGNPTSRNCDFFKKTQDRLWKHYKITCFDSPNLKAAGIHSIADIKKEVETINTLDDEDALDWLSSYPRPYPFLIDTRWVIEKAIEWGVDHPLFKGKVLGEFPDADSNILISEEDVLRSWDRDQYNVAQEEIGYIGLDVARFGEDKSVLTSMVGNDQQAKKSMAKQDTNQVVGHALNFIADHQKRFPLIKNWRLAVDGGFGHGVIDRFMELQKDEANDRKDSPAAKKAYEILKTVEVLEINFGSTDWTLFHTGWKGETITDQHKQTQEYKKKARKIQEDRENYVNFKAKMFDLLAKDVKSFIKLIKDDIYKKQLPTIISDIDSKGRLKIESKEDYKKRTGENSPDESDSVALCNFARYFAVGTLDIIDAIKKAKAEGKINHSNNKRRQLYGRIRA